MCGGLTIGPRDHKDVQAVIDCAEELDLDHEVLDQKERAARYPQFGLDENEVGVFDPVAGIFRPELAVLTAREESERLGAKYRPYTRVRNLRPTEDGIIVHTPHDPPRMHNGGLPT